MHQTLIPNPIHSTILSPSYDFLFPFQVNTNSNLLSLPVQSCCFLLQFLLMIFVKVAWWLRVNSKGDGSPITGSSGLWGGLGGTCVVEWSGVEQNCALVWRTKAFYSFLPFPILPQFIYYSITHRAAVSFSHFTALNYVHQIILWERKHWGNSDGMVIYVLNLLLWRWR